MSLTIRLENPVEVDGEMISSFSIRPPTAEDVRAVRALNVGRNVRGLRFISRLIDISPAVWLTVAENEEKATAAVQDFIFEHMGW